MNVKRTYLPGTLLTICLSLFSWLPAGAPAAETLTVVSDQWCPYSCVPGSDMEGSTVELLRAIFEPRGISVVYRVATYSESLEETLAGKNDAVLNGGLKEFEGWVVPQEESGLARFAAFVRKESAWTYTGPESLVGKKLGVVEGYQYDQGGKLDTWIDENPGSVESVSGDNALDLLLQKLLAGEVDVVVDDVQVFKMASGRRNTRDKFREAGVVNELPVYVGFSPARAESGKYADWFTQGIRDLRADGRLGILLGKYDMTDWKR